VIDIFVGFDDRHAELSDVCAFSMRNSSEGLAANIGMLDLMEMRRRKLYYRPTEMRGNKLWDRISDAPMSTDYALSRFLAPIIGDTAWVLFCDNDFLWRGDMEEMLALADDKYAVMCVKHHHDPAETIKMDAQIQTVYERKNWSSLVLWNRRHPANRALTVDLINHLPGCDLHRFFWLKDDQIGELPAEWNWIDGASPPDVEPKAVHFTRGGPWLDDLPGLESFSATPYADEWLALREQMRGGHTDDDSYSDDAQLA